VSVARHRVGGGVGPGESSYAQLPVRPMGEVRTRYHVSLDVEDRPGVLAQVAHVFAEHGVSIETVRQQTRARDRGEGVLGAAAGSDRRAALVIVTHRARDAALAATVDALAGLDTVASVDSVMRVEGLGEEGD
jgi:homoserine dehydrogenase